MLADQVSAFCRAHIAGLRAAETALIIGLAATAWAASGMFTAAPLLTFAALISWAAIYATDLRADRKLLASVAITVLLIIEGSALNIRFQEANNTEVKIEMAHRWINLSNDILSDIHSIKYGFHMPPTDQGMTSELRNRLWQDETNRATDTFNNAMAAMKQKYSGRLAEAEIEMKNMNISMIQGAMPLDGPLVNSFSFEAWASKLGGEGRRILIENGTTP
jgi:hypothetical protein